MKRGQVLSLVMLVCLAFILGFFTHRNEWIPDSLRTSLRSAINSTAGPETFGPNRADVDEDKPFDRRYGEWGVFTPPQGSDEIDQDAKDALESIGYLTASEPAPAQSGVTRYEPSEVEPGINLYISGHAAEAYLMDMDGTVRHTWKHDFYDIWPEYSPPKFMRATGHAYWRRVKAYDNGDLLAIHEGIGLIKLDKDSNLRWALRGGFHHDFHVQPDGTIIALAREAKMLPRMNPDSLVLEPQIAVVSADGEELRRVSLLEMFERSKYAPLLKQLPPEEIDLFHTNTIEVLDGSHEEQSPFFAKGKILISIWSMNLVAIVDIETETVDYATTGMWSRQHEPTLLPDGRMLIFDNRGNNGHSQILEFDPFTHEIVWAYRGTESDTFATEWCGAVHRLENGNTLITETNNGRAFEVTRDGRIVWEFINPHQMEIEDGMTLISSLWEVIRLDSNFGEGWIAQ